MRRSDFRRARFRTPVYPRFASAEDFHIETQMMFDNLLKQQDLKSTRFFWRKQVDEEIFPGMYKGTFNISVSGKLKDFALLHGKLVSENPSYRILNFGAQVKKQSQQSIGNVQVTFTVAAYYWLGGN